MRMPSLYQFFRHQVSRGFHAHGIAEPATVDYVSDVLTRFAHTRHLYALLDEEGRPLEYIVDMLIALERAYSGEGGGRPDRARGRTINRHIGEYALFMSGLFRERLTARGELDYYLASGSGAYGRAADDEINPARRRVYQRLHDDFGRISDSLDHMRRVQFPMKDSSSGGGADILRAFWRT
jgi:hypothetical protein